MKLPNITFELLESSKIQTQRNIATAATLSVIVLLLVTIFLRGLFGDYFKILVVVAFALAIVSIPVVLIWYFAVYQRNINDLFSKFATKNNVSFIRKKDDPDYNGMLFNRGEDRHIKDQFIIPTDGEPIELGNYYYTTGSGKNRTTHRYGYVRAKLPRRLPHMVLDATANNLAGRFSTLPQQFNSSQKLSLEGDFDKYFTLYTPDEYERDALYVFTPDVMQAMITHARNYDIEIIDSDLYLYRTKPFDFLQVDEWKQALAVISTLTPELSEQTDYYADERIFNRNANAIAPQGQRLKSTTPWLLIAGVIVFTIGQYFIPFLLASGNNADRFPLMSFLAAGIMMTGIFVAIYFKNKRKP